jgi:ABC-type multidrug transport system permease subunit
LREVEANRLSAALILPRQFTSDYLLGRGTVTLELVKNPAQSIHPTVIEELAGVVVTALNALSRNFQSEFPAWQEVLEGRADHRRVAELVTRAGDKVDALRLHLAPPLVTYSKEVRAKAEAPVAAVGTKFNLFGYLLAGLAAMFMLFLASTALLDLQRELRLRTFQRYHTLHHRLGGFLTAKILFGMVSLMICVAVMLGGGGLIFRIDWRHPWVLVALAAGYAWFCAGFMAALLALLPDEHRAGTLSNIAGMALGLAGGCAFPPQQLPDLIRLHVTPLLPSFWFGDTVRTLEFGPGDAAWPLAVAKLAAAGAVCLALAAWLYRRRFARGIR